MKNGQGRKRKGLTLKPVRHQKKVFERAKSERKQKSRALMEKVKRSAKRQAVPREATRGGSRVGKKTGFSKT